MELTGEAPALIFPPAFQGAALTRFFYRLAPGAVPAAATMDKTDES